MSGAALTPLCALHLDAAFSTDTLLRMQSKNLNALNRWCAGCDSLDTLMQVFIKGSQNTSQALIDIVKNKTYGKCNHAMPSRESWGLPNADQTLLMLPVHAGCCCIYLGILSYLSACCCSGRF